ncbi:MAG: nitrogen fixation/metabolism regulation signal transduction histidine kinase [Spirosomataceae bacterium]|jgi:nitrogen fixation/metabolism regulation signal transduction histidine kinase
MKNFAIGIMYRVGVLTLTCFGLAWSILQEQWPITIFILLVLSVQVSSIYVYLVSINRKLTSFLEAIRYEDFAISFRADNGLGASFRDLNNQFNEVVQSFRKVRAEREANLHFINAIVQQISVGILSYDTSGNIEIANQATNKLLNIYRLRKLDDIKQHAPVIYEKLTELKSGKGALVNLDGNELSLNATDIQLRGKMVRLVSIQNIRSELQLRELEAWQNLTKVLRHEIMNSITPIVSLIGTMKIIVDNEIEVHDDQSKESVEDLQEALKTIEKRGNGVMDFVNAYRDFTTIPKPNKQYLTINELLESTIALTSPELEKVDVDFEIEIEGDFSVFADPSLMEQVLINLIKNASEARSKENSRVELKAYQTNERCIIEVEDNGMGIENEALSKVFIPFFTTKKAGSGIGLSLSRQIVQMHGGEITVKSEINKGTTFRIVL